MDKSQHSFVSQGGETRHYVYNWIIKTLHKNGIYDTQKTNLVLNIISNPENEYFLVRTPQDTIGKFSNELSDYDKLHYYNIILDDFKKYLKTSIGGGQIIPNYMIYYRKMFNKFIVLNTKELRIIFLNFNLKYI